jgi:hypothetical protein
MCFGRSEGTVLKTVSLLCDTVRYIHKKLSAQVFKYAFLEAFMVGRLAGWDYIFSLISEFQVAGEGVHRQPF